MKDPARAFAQLLETAGAGIFAASSGWSINVGLPPSAPDTSILVNHVGGTSPFPSLLLNQPTVQIVVRGGRNGYVVARDKMTDVVDILLGLGNVVVNGDTYRAILQLGDVATLGFDDSLRPMFSANFKAYVLPAPSALSQRVPIE